MKSGKAVMGAGNAKEARDAFPGLDLRLATLLNQHGNRAFRLGTFQWGVAPVTLISFPTKYDWKEHSSLPLIETSAIQLREMIQKFGLTSVYLPAPGCSNGKLKWSEVEPRLRALIGMVTVYSQRPDTFSR